MSNIETISTMINVRDAAFRKWLAKVDQHLVRKCGMTHEDLPDWLYYDAYEDGIRASVAASRALKAAKADMGM